MLLSDKEYTEKERELIRHCLQTEFVFGNAKQRFRDIPEEYKPLCKKALNTAMRYINSKIKEDQCKELGNEILDICGTYANKYSNISVAFESIISVINYSINATKYPFNDLNKARKTIKDERKRLKKETETINNEEIFKE